MFRIIIPKSLFSANDKLFSVYCFLCGREDRSGVATFSLEEVIEYSGRKANTRNVEVVQDYISALTELIAGGYIADISRYITLDNSATKTMRSFQLKDKMFHCDDLYAEILSDEIDRIKEYCIANPTAKFITLLNLFIYFKAEINHGRKGYKVLCTRLNKIAEDIHLSGRTLNGGIDALVNCGLIKYKKIPNKSTHIGDNDRKTYQIGYYVFAAANRRVFRNGKFITDETYNAEKEIDGLINTLTGNIFA